GNRAAVISAPEQTHLVRTLDSSDLSFDRITFLNSLGDAIKLISTSRVVVKGGHVRSMRLVIDTGIVGAGVACSGTSPPSVMIGPNILGAGAPFAGPCERLPFSSP